MASKPKESLQLQIKSARQQVKSWPQWMKSSAHLSTTGTSTVQVLPKKIRSEPAKTAKQK